MAGDARGEEAVVMLVAAGDEKAVAAEFARHVRVVEGVANEADVFGRTRKFAQELAAVVEFGVAVKIVDAADAGEEMREVVMVEGF